MSIQPSFFDDREFDQLAEGELSEDRRRALLKSLDSQPEEWRRCALAFLRAQALREALGESALSNVATVKQAPSHLPGPAAGETGHVAWREAALRIFTIAACLLVTFCLGAFFERGSAARRQSNVASAPLAPMLRPDASSQPSETRIQPQLAHDGSSLPAKALGSAVLVFDGASPRQEELRLPLFAAEDFERQWLEAQPLAPRKLLQELEQAGQEVRRRRFWIPLRLDDGSEALAPVEELHIAPANHRVFQ